MAKIPVMKKVQHIRSLATLWRHRAAFARMGRDVAGGRYKLSVFTIIALVFGIFYIISPIDLIPDFIPIIGWMDDGLVFYFLIKRLMAELERYEARNGALRIIRK